LRKEAIENKLPDPLLPVIEICKDLPQSLSDLISKGMSLEAQNRPTDAHQMKMLLEEAEMEFSFQNFLNNPQSLDPEIVTVTSPTKIKNDYPKIQIPIKSPKLPSTKW